MEGVSGVGREGVRVPFDEGGIGQNYTDNVEAHTSPLDSGTAGVVAAGAAEKAFLFRIDSALRGTVFQGGARLHFDKNQGVALPRNQVDFAAAGTRPVAARHDGATLTAQITMRQVFTQPAMIAGLQVMPHNIGRTIQKTEHGVL